ncbi:hypothetical protein FRC08_012264 [Ceratobasidium sp. 394]|nr:hypothetical protein FRC08_012264 [Ceratobasidium sp. 394]KAG9094918.1 hypothetical protein FS749_011524 [Ceratobasidium sp. UAMH 11750]
MHKHKDHHKVDYALQCANWPNHTLIHEEISHRRALASYITSLTLTAGSTAGSAGALAPLALPIASFKLYKIKSHRTRLKLVRAELERRNLSPACKRKRDVLVPVAVTFAAYTVTLGLADVLDLVPESLQHQLESQVEDFFGVEERTGGLDKVGDQYEAFMIAEAITPLTNRALHSHYPGPPPLPPRPARHFKSQ